MLKRSVAILATTACLGLLVAPQAQAAPPSDLASYGAGSSATSLVLNLLGQEVGVSATTAAVSSSPQPTAAADGAALLIAGNPVPGGAPSLTPGGAAHNETDAPTCPFDLGDVTSDAVDGLSASIACVETDATVTGGSPDAASESGEVSIDLQGLSGTALEPILAPVVDALVDGLDQADTTLLCGQGGLLNTLGVCTAVDPVIDVEGLVQEVIGDVDQVDAPDFTVLQIAVGPSRSHDAASAEDGVVAESGSNATTISLFPGVFSSVCDLVDLCNEDTPSDALLTVRLSSANAQVVRDASTGKADTTASAAQLLSIDTTDNLGVLADILKEKLPDLVDQLTAPLAALSCDGGALADLVCVDLGGVNDLDHAELVARGYDYGADTVGVEATAADVQVLPILGDALGADVLDVQLAQASAAAVATPAQETTTTTAPPETPQDQPPLPHTGGSNAFPLAMLLFGAATVSAVLVRRTRTTA